MGDRRPMISQRMPIERYGGELPEAALLALRNYLAPLARRRMSRQLQAKLDPSDVVQETFLAAHVNLGRFRGTDDRSLQAWLKRILASRWSAVLRRFLVAQSRRVDLERSLSGGKGSLGNLLACLPQSSPSQHVMRQERIARLLAAMERLPAEYRSVVSLRHFEGLTFDEVARRLGRSDRSVRRLWARALAALSRELEDLDDESCKSS